MNNVTLKIKQLDKDKPFKVPTKAYGDAAAFDLYVSTTEFEKVPTGKTLYVCKFNLAVEFPSNYVMLLFPRSSIAKQALRLTNAVGVIDHDYRGEVMVKFDIIKPEYDDPIDLYKEGDACVQAILIEKPKVELILLKDGEELSTTQRGTGGFGSSTDSNSVFGTAGEIRV